MGGNDRLGWDGGGEGVVGERRIIMGHLESFPHLNARVLLPPGGGWVARKETRPGEQVRGSSPGSATC